MEPDLPFPLAYRGIYKERQREVDWQLYDSIGVRRANPPSKRKIRRNY